MHLILSVVFVISFVGSDALSCVPCDKVECKTFDPSKCLRGSVKNVCGCCLVCAKDLDEICGGSWNISGICGTDLHCCPSTKSPEKPLPEDGAKVPVIVPVNFQVGTCKDNSTPCPT